MIERKVNEVCTFKIQHVIELSDLYSLRSIHRIPHVDFVFVYENKMLKWTLIFLVIKSHWRKVISRVILVFFLILYAELNFLDFSVICVYWKTLYICVSFIARFLWYNILKVAWSFLIHVCSLGIYGGLIFSKHLHNFLILCLKNVLLHQFRRPTWFEFMFFLEFSMNFLN